MLIQSKDYIKNPLVSVLIISYNQEHYISQCIESVLEQETDYPFEIIIGEDCGTDSTQNICIEYQRKYPDIIKLILHEKNGGVVNNWLACIKHASGKYITSCAGDDYWHNPHKLKLQFDYMELNPDCGVLHTDFDELNTVSNTIINSVYKSQSIKVKQGYLQKEIFDGSLKMCAATICYRKDLFDKYIPVEKYLELNFPIEDWPTLLILSHYTKINYLDVSTVTYRKGHESISNPRSYEKTIDRFTREKRMYKYLCDMFPGDLEYDEKGYDIYVNGVLLSLAYKRRDATKAKEFAGNMLKLGDKSWRTHLSTNWFGFWMWWLLKQVAR
jgi:glycosyltransferase involved in cell wall biosynthesis